jgi:type IV pilus assembly protein PilW
MSNGICRYAGLSLVELMISLAIGMFVVLAGTSLLLSTKSGYAAQGEAALIEDTGRYVLENISRSVRQAAYENWDSTEAPIVSKAVYSANIAGFDARTLKGASEGIDVTVARAVNGSDVLAVRFFGSGPGPNGDGTVVNCAGFSVPAPASQANAEEERGWSIYYVADDATGEPELYCKYRGDSGWTSQAIARGVESFPYAQ